MTESDANAKAAYDAANWLKARARAGGDEMTEEDKKAWAEVGKGCLTPEDLESLWKWFRK